MNKPQAPSSSVADGLVVSMDCEHADQCTRSPFTLPTALKQTASVEVQAQSCSNSLQELTLIAGAMLCRLKKIINAHFFMQGELIL